MPLYDFRCTGCAHVFDVMKPIAERHESATCPQCGAESFLQLSATAVLTGAPACDGNLGACPSGAPFAAPPCAGRGGKCPV